ncbi:hypothetical protein QBC40DRAFT_283331 [Triangularia verruculosa]|uniref:Uncharacterized protein n=1 Tax=Triangularia verruculosa TaxID=2587418 RepID=A0AAN6XDK6_9PEZI|nr:hypothetical protein QBC40DRAFT_283331 [Triangularia verruculosa]
MCPGFEVVMLLTGLWVVTLMAGWKDRQSLLIYFYCSSTPLGHCQLDGQEAPRTASGGRHKSILAPDKPKVC